MYFYFYEFKYQNPFSFELSNRENFSINVINAKDDISEVSRTEKLNHIRRGTLFHFNPIILHVFSFSKTTNKQTIKCRCGMVYYDPQDLGWRPFVKSWMQTVGGKFKQETQVSRKNISYFLCDIMRGYQ